MRSTRSCSTSSATREPGAIATQADAAADPGLPATGRWARRARAEDPGVAAAGGVGRPAGQHAESRAALAARADRGGRAVEWEDPSLAQLWGPRYSTYVVPKRDFALFSLGRFPDDDKGRRRAERMAELSARRTPRCAHDGPRGRARDRHRERDEVRRDDGHDRHPLGGRAGAGRLDGPRSRRSSRRTRVASSPGATSTSSGRPRPRASPAGRGSRGARGPLPSPRSKESLLPVRSPLGDEWLLAEDEPAMRAAETAARAGTPAAERRCLLPARPERAGAARPAGGPAAAALDVPRVAGRPPRRGRDPRNLETGAARRDDRRLGAAVAREARSSRGRGCHPAPAGPRPADRGGLEHLSGPDFLL